MRYWKEKKNIPSDIKVGISLVTYNQTFCLETLINCLKGQTFKNFIVTVIHDGSWISDAKKSFENAVGGDSRFIAMNSSKRENKFGHNNRQVGFDKLKSFGCNWLGTMNGDCYYVPVYFESMLSKAFEDNANFVYCNMIHSHKNWNFFETNVELSKIDAGCFLANIDLISKHKWDSFEFAADWIFISKLKNDVEFRSTKAESVLFVHN